LGHFLKTTSPVLSQQLRTCANALNEQTHTQLQDILSEKLPHCSRQDIETGVQNAKKRINHRINRYCDKFETYAKKNVFGVPENFPLQNTQPNEQYYKLSSEKVEELEEEKKTLQKKISRKITIYKLFKT